MPSFKIADCPTSLTTTAGADGRVAEGKLSLTVRNGSDRLQTARITIESTDGADPSWFAIDGAPPTRPHWLECDFEPNTTQTLGVSVKAPRQAEQKTYTFRVKATAEADPDNDYAESPVVSLVVPALDVEPPPPPFKWWKVAAAAAVVLVIGIGAWYALRPTAPELPAGLVGAEPDAAIERLLGAGFTDDDITVEQGPPVGNPPNTVAEVNVSGGGSRVTLVVDPGVTIEAPERSPLEQTIAGLIRDGLEPEVARVGAQDVSFFLVQTVTPPHGTTVARGSKVNITTFVPRTGGQTVRCPPFCLDVVLDVDRLPAEFVQPQLPLRNRVIENLNNIQDRQILIDPNRLQIDPNR